MQILMIGAGAIGGYFGARLLAAGRDVSFLVRERRAAQLAASGLVVKSAQGDLTLPRPPALRADQIHRPFDLIVVSCKAYDLAEAIEAFAPAVGPRTLILPLLNGMAHLEALDARFSRQAVLGGKCTISSTLDDAGSVLHLNLLHSLSFGERGGGLSPRVEAVRAQLAGAGFDAVASVQIVQDMWEKWVFLAALAASTCLMRASVGTILAVPQGEALLLQMFDECSAIAASQGHTPAPAFAAQARTMLTTPGSTIKASMLRDIERRARIEGDHVVGDLLQRRPAGREGGPVLSALELAYTHLKAYEASRG
ncbi:MAG: 2-dehydropantoate 2-reductase [Rubrivivax sp.]